MRIAPDMKDPLQQANNGGGNNHGNRQRGLKIGFMPGTVTGIADDMSDGFGGTDKKWVKYLNTVYSPVRMPDFNFGGRGGKGNGKGGGKNDDGANKGGGKDPNEPDPNVIHGHDYRMAPMASQPAQGGFLNVGPVGQRMPPVMGLLGQPQARQAAPAPSGFLPPEIQQLLTRGR